jgi:hypothetical protein
MMDTTHEMSTEQCLGSLSPRRSAGRFAPARTAPRASPSASSLLAALAAAEPAVAADTRLVHFVPSLARLTRGAVGRSCRTEDCISPGKRK